MPNPFKRGNIWWGQVYKDGVPKMFSLETTNKQEAKKRLEYEYQKIHSLKLSKVLYEWIKNKTMEMVSHDRSKSGFTPYMKMVSYKWNMLIKEFGDVPISSIKQEDIIYWKAGLLLDYKESTVSIILRQIRVVFSFAKGMEYIQKDPFKGVKLPKSPNRKEFFTKNELKKFYDVIDRPLIKLYFEFMVKTGIRTSEMRNFKWSDIDFDAKNMVFSGKEGERNFTIWPEHKILLKKIERLQSSDQGDIFFCNENGDSLVNHDRIGKLFKKYIKKSKLHETKPGLVPYSLRHTYATLLIQSGQFDIFYVSKLLGHSDVRMTQKFYEHVKTSDIPKTNLKKVFG